MICVCVCKSKVIFNFSCDQKTFGAKTLNFGSVAQLVEQRSFKPRVAGSSPAWPTRIFHGGIAQSVEQLTLNQHVVGSIPTPFTNIWCSGTSGLTLRHRKKTMEKPIHICRDVQARPLIISSRLIYFIGQINGSIKKEVSPML